MTIGIIISMLLGSFCGVVLAIVVHNYKNRIFRKFMKSADECIESIRIFKDALEKEKRKT